MKPKIMIVEDDLDSLKLIGLTLEPKGYQIIAAQNGSQALEKAFSDRPDLIILDVMMPKLDGLEVCRRLRADPRTLDVPIVMLTAKAQASDKVAGFKAGADEYLTKPIHPAELVLRVEAQLSRATQEAATPQLERKAKIVGILGCRGGVGTTTLAVNTAISLVRGPARDKTVMLVEFRNGMSTIALQLGLESRGGIANLLQRQTSTLNSDLIRDQMEQHPSGLLVLTGQPMPLGMNDQISPAHVSAILNHLGTTADYILIDMGADLGNANRAALNTVDHVLIVVEPNRVGLTLAQGMLTSLKQLNVQRNKIGIILLQRTASAAGFSKRTAEEFLHQDVVGTIPPAPELAFQSAEHGAPMVLMQASSIVSGQFGEVAKFISAL